MVFNGYSSLAAPRSSISLAMNAPERCGSVVVIGLRKIAYSKAATGRQACPELLVVLDRRMSSLVLAQTTSQIGVLAPE